VNRGQALTEVGVVLLVVLLVLVTLGLNVPLFRTLLGIALTILVVGVICRLFWDERADDKGRDRGHLPS
jgi:uncharacterized membrane protein YccC